MLFNLVATVDFTVTYDGNAAIEADLVIMSKACEVLDTSIINVDKFGLETKQQIYNLF